jgi:ferredoxin-NADP reductase
VTPSFRQVLEAVLAGMSAGTIVTFTAFTLSQSLSGAKADSKASAGLLSTLVGAGLGGIAGLVINRKSSAQGQKARSVGQTEKDAGSEDWKDWRPFKVVGKVKESEEITSFHLEPLESGSLPSFKPGQFLTIRLTIPGQLHPVVRTYSLSDYPLEGKLFNYRLSIKREPSPKGQDVPPGVASNFMHDHVQEGAIIEAKPPRGSFVLDLAQSTPAVLISNGVGITPMIAMLKATVSSNPRRKIWFFHGARDGQFHAFLDEVAISARISENVSIHYAYSKPRAEDQASYHSEGYVDASLIGSMVKEAADYFICGSPPFLDSIRSGLMQQGVPSENIRFEMFGKARHSAPAVVAPVEVAKSSVTFTRSNRTVQWEGDAASLLEFAEANGLSPDFSCRAGVCGTCECKLLNGEVSYHEEPTASVAPGSVLICIARPKSDQIALDL